MRRSGKVWGATSPIFNKANVEVHYLQIDKGGYCSKHKHTHKFNMFFVLEGSLIIEEWKDDLEDKTTLSVFDTCIIAPGNYHRFEAPVKTKALEIYWTELDTKDIQRESQGGKK